MNQKKKDTNKKRAVRLALGQLNPTVGDFERNAERIIKAIEQAERKKTDLIVFPELAICGYPVWDLANKKGFVDQGIKMLKRVAKFTRGKRITAVLGFIGQAKSAKKKNFNSLAVIRNGRIIHTQAKTLLPTYDVFLEEIFFAPATTYETFSLNGFSIGATICEDIWDDGYDKKPARVLKQMGAEIIVNVSASPYANDGVKKRVELVSRKAKEYGVWIVYVNQVGGQDDLIFDGRSFVVNPMGRVVYSAKAFEDGVFYTSIETKTTSGKKGAVTTRRSTKEVYDALVLGLSDYIRKNEFKKVAIGLSGGIDSALVATLACDALGTQSIIGVALPGPYSSKESLDDARALAQALGIEFRVKSIVLKYEQFLSETVSDQRDRGAPRAEEESITVAMENLQARLRGLELMYISNDEHALLLTTGNKSELAMGYTTLYGDMCGGLSVIGDVYKTDVYRLARYRNSIGRVIPDAIIRKAPSAELRPNQRDQDSLPEYSILDAILYRYIEKNESFAEIVMNLRPQSISEQVIRRVLSTVDHNEYKRRQLPPALRITEKAWFGRRMPITNKFEG